MRVYSVRKVLLFVVWFLHGVFVLLLFLQPHFPQPKKDHKTLLVKTIKTKPLPAVVARTSPPRSPASAPRKEPPTTAPASLPQPKPVASATQKKTPPAKKATTPSPTTKKEPAIADKKLSTEKKKAQAPQKKAEPRAKISDSLMKELEESIANLDKKPSHTTSSHTKPMPLVLQIDSSTYEENGSEESTYVDLLVDRLRQSLSLPDYGEVKIQLNLRQDGSVVRIVVLKAQSKENRRYLEETLPYTRFPPFEGALAHQRESTFILTFVNAM